MAREKEKKEKKTSPYPRKQKRKFCYFCKEKITYIDYKDIGMLRRFLSERGKIRPRRVTGTCTRHQAGLSKAIKNAREVALLQYPHR
ncbi:MAG: 30S ribosomal protein S18 [Candidatus Anoxymicrobium japonicum]|uniref:Small ribosomal subunit protein bS18 n=1 Tax=Candidatus Anoxymicrobium japonicum TaxID=2013648 RepID=A0A2N3G5B1_9ACTN|nr:MAG: 30S ribosomal protein S18 [Candidatus Anoxymicrobium japonicum]